jgi:Protein kinase domain/Cache domain
MNDEEVLDELLSVWLREGGAGHELSPAELTRDRPDLVGELERRISIMRRMNDLALANGATLSYAQTLAAPSSSPPPLSPPGYDVQGELGRGGMGVVYTARQVSLNRVVALKMILSGAHADTTDLARFRKEAETIARLQHPNIVQIHEVGEHDGRPFFSLELCSGGSLERKLNGTPLPPQEAAALVETLARAMAAAHQKDIIHRDLKPANVLLTEDGVPKVTDFGLAKKLDGDADAAGGLTETGNVMGTPSYMAPEQALGKSDVGRAADVYALGAILYECLSGRPPFRAATPMDTIMQVIADDPVPVRQLQMRVPRDLETICLKCLKKEPANRYAGAADLADDLRRFRNGEPIRARPAGVAERLGRWCRRRPAWAVLIATSILALLALLGGGLWFNRQVRAELEHTRQAERRLQLAFTDEVADNLDGDLRQIAEVPQTVALALEVRTDWTEKQLEAWMRSALGNDDRLFGLCAAFEPFAFDCDRRDFALYVYRTPEGVRKIHLLQGQYEKLPYREWPWYRIASSEERGRWGEPYIDKDGGEVPMVTYSAPVRRDGDFVGVVTADLSIDYFQKLHDDLKALNFGPSSYGFVVSDTGRFISHPDKRFDLKEDIRNVASQQADPALTAVVGGILSHKADEGRATDFATGRPARFLFAPVRSSGWSVVAVIPDAE